VGAQAPEAGAGLAPVPTAEDRALIWAGRLLYGGLSLCSALLFGVLDELHGLPDARARVAALLPLPPLCAVLATLAWARLGRGRALGPAALLPAAAGLVVFGLALLTPLAARLPLAALGASLLGVAFASFLAAFRGAASSAALAAISRPSGAKLWPSPRWESSSHRSGFQSAVNRHVCPLPTSL
jgi:hypothetical protein